MTLPIVELTDTFDVWRTRTNQLVTLTNDIDDSPILNFTSNSSPLTLSSNAFRKGNVYLQLSSNSDFNNTQTTTLATSKAVNDTYVAAFNRANSVGAAGNTYTLAAFNKANTIGTLGTQSSSSVTITGGSISGITDLAIADGGTGASDASNARINLGLGALAVKSTIAASDIDANAVTGTKIGITSQAQGDLMYYSGTEWTRLAAGTSGVRFLRTNGTSAAPSWVFLGGISFTTTTGAAITASSGVTISRLGAGSYLVTHNIGSTSYIPVISAHMPLIGDTGLAEGNARPTSGQYTVSNLGANSFRIDTYVREVLQSGDDNVDVTMSEAAYEWSGAVYVAILGI